MRGVGLDPQGAVMFGPDLIEHTRDFLGGFLRGLRLVRRAPIELVERADEEEVGSMLTTQAIQPSRVVSGSEIEPLRTALDPEGSLVVIPRNREEVTDAARDLREPILDIDDQDSNGFEVLEGEGVDSGG
jgi:hypothetical protein